MHCNLNKKIVLALITGCFSVSSFAQFIWLDANGSKQYSDQPPPASVPKNRILKAPGGQARNTSSTLPPDAATGAPTPGAPAAPGETGVAAPKTPMTTAERNADFVKRRSDQAERDRKAGLAAQEAAAKAANCEKAQAYARSLESGVRIATIDQNGEQAFMSDEKRAKETSDTKRALSGCR